MLLQNEKACEQAALKLLTARDYSEQELRGKLERLGFDKEAIATVIGQFIQRGYLNDAALCRMLFTKYLATGKYGIHVITGKLKQRGLPASVIATVNQEADDTTEEARALEAARRKFAKASVVNAGKTARFLAYRGFSAETIRKVVKQLFNDEQES